MMIVFNSLSKENIFKIIDIELASLFSRINALGYEIVLTEGAKEFISEKGYDSQFGARPLKRAIQKHLEDPIAEEILKGELAEEHVMEVDYNKETDSITISPKAAASKKKKEPQLPEGDKDSTEE